jgi:uncharacterized protein
MLEPREAQLRHSPVRSEYAEVLLFVADESVAVRKSLDVHARPGIELVGDLIDEGGRTGHGPIVPPASAGHGSARVNPDKMSPVGFDQYHEPPEELPKETRTFARLCASLTEEAEAIGWYEQRISVEPDRQARAIMRDAQGEEFKHFSMNLEFLLRRSPLWREIAEGILFQGGDIVEHGEEAEEEATEEEASRGAPLVGSESLGIGGLRGSGT